MANLQFSSVPHITTTSKVVYHIRTAPMESTRVCNTIIYVLFTCYTLVPCFTLASKSIVSIQAGPVYTGIWGTVIDIFSTGISCITDIAITHVISLLRFTCTMHAVICFAVIHLSLTTKQGIN